MINIIKFLISLLNYIIEYNIFKIRVLLKKKMRNSLFFLSVKLFN